MGNTTDMTDFQLCQWFRKGWYDEKRGTTSSPPDHNTDTCYDFGVKEYQRCGGECLYTDEEILKIVKG